MKVMTLEEQVLKLKAGEEDFAANWHDPEVELPDESCNVLALSKHGFPMHLPYSQRYKVFNVFDFFDQGTAFEQMMTVCAWAHIPEWWFHVNDTEERDEEE